MNKNTTTILGISAVVVVAIIGWWAISKNMSPESTLPLDTPIDTPSTEETPITSSPSPESGAPIVVTDQKVAATDTTVILTGEVTPNGVFTSYWYEYGTSLSLGKRTASQMIGSGFAAIPAPVYITGLSEVTTYYFRLNAQNQFGTVAGTQYSFQTTRGTPPPVGSAPTIKTIAASGISRTTANLNGEVTPNRASTQYWFEYGQSPNLGNTTALQSVGDGTGKSSASISLSALNPATTYYFRLNAQNQFGTVNGAILNFKTAGPVSAAAPSVTTRNVTDLGVSTATFHGTVNPNNAETNYWFEYSTDSLLGSVLLNATEQKSAGAGSNTISVEADVSGLNPKTNYYFRLVAQNSFGVVRGDRASFKTK